MMTRPDDRGRHVAATLERAAELVDHEASARSNVAPANGAGCSGSASRPTSSRTRPAGLLRRARFHHRRRTGGRAPRADGHLTVMTTQAPHGQSHETTLAQVAATEFGVPIAHVRVLYGDTSWCRSARWGQVARGPRRWPAGPRCTRPGRSRARRSTTPATCSRSRRRTSRSSTRGQVKGDPELGWDSRELARGGLLAVPRRRGERSAPTVRSTQPPGGYSGGTHVCFVEIDPETGIVQIPPLRGDRGLRLADQPGDRRRARSAAASRRGRHRALRARPLQRGGQRSSPARSWTICADAMEIPTIGIEHFDCPPIAEVNYRGVGEGGTIAAPPRSSTRSPTRSGRARRAVTAHSRPGDGADRYGQRAA